MDAHSFVARNFAYLYVVGGRQHSMDAVAEMQGTVSMALCQERAYGDSKRYASSYSE